MLGQIELVSRLTSRSLAMPEASTIKTLNRLIEVSRHGEKGYAASAKDVSDPELAAVLRARGRSAETHCATRESLCGCWEASRARKAV